MQEAYEQRGQGLVVGTIRNQSSSWGSPASSAPQLGLESTLAPVVADDVHLTITKPRASIDDLVYPWPLEVNQHLGYAESQARRWVINYGLFETETDRSPYDKVDLGRLCAYAYPYANRDRLALITELMWWIFREDDIYDDPHATKEHPDRLAGRFERYLEILRRREAPRNANPAERSFGDVVERLDDLTSTGWMTRFTETMRRFWIEGCVNETLYRSSGIVPDPGSYMAMRVQSVGAYPFCDLIEVAYEFELSRKVRENSIFRRMCWLAVRAIAYVNDIFSYEKERRVGDVSNYLHVKRYYDHIDVLDAVDVTIRAHNIEIQQFCQLEELMPDFGEEENLKVAFYIAAVKTWLAGALEWQRVSGRYESCRAYLESGATEPVHSPF